MDATERMREAARLRLAFQSRGRMRLEFLSELSKVLRAHGVEVEDELLGSLVLAVPEELPTEGGLTAFPSSGKKTTEKPSD